MEFGDITILKNICFSDGVVDHSYRLGRPCIYIGEDLNHMYFVPLANLNSKIKEKQFVIAPKAKNNLTKKSRIRASELITRPVAFYELYGRLDHFDIQKLIESLRFFYKDDNPNFQLINHLIDKYINYVDLELNVKDKAYDKHK